MEAKQETGNSTVSTPPASTLLIQNTSSPSQNGKGVDCEDSDKKEANQEEDKHQQSNSVTQISSKNSANDHEAQAAAACKRVRFSVCEYITETLVHENGSHCNPAFQNDESDKGDTTTDAMDSDGGSKKRYIGGRLRRDSVHPLVPSHQLKEKNNDWDISLPQSDAEDEKGEGIPWSDLSTKGKLLRLFMIFSKVIGLLALLYIFVCSLDLLSLGFRLVGGRTAGEVFQNSSILQNPVVGLMLGILTTVLVQSSSTSSSILVGMVAAGFLDVRLAIPPIMGANIGTSITNTIVSFTQAGDRAQFRRAFAAATVLDMFNWITVIVLLPIEVIFGYLYHVSKATADLLIPDKGSSGGEVQVLTLITKPFVDLIVQLNDTVLECWATPNCTDADDASLIREYCSTSTTEIEVHERVVDLNGKELLNIKDVARQEDPQKCDFLFAGTSWSDVAVGTVVLLVSLIVLCSCLVAIVKLLNTVMQGHVSRIIQRTLNADIPYVPWLTGYIAILIGAVMTFLVQSSSVFTSALTPLVGMGVISLSRVYPLTLGANIGTTTTALLASLAAEGKSLHPSLQIALCHFFFNITGVILFYPVPYFRFPITMAKVLGDITAKYRWFAIFYLVAMFGVIPVIFIALSLAGSIYVIVLVSLIGAIVFIVAIVTLLQRKAAKILPAWLQDWKWLPEPMRSLRPYDKLVGKIPCCRGKGGKSDDDDYDSDEEAFGDDDENRFSDGGRSKLDGGFIFLTGNKIPPPNGFNEKQDDRPQQKARRIITRIVPTRVIRNISNGDTHPPRNGDRRIGNMEESQGNGTVSTSSLPVPPINENRSSDNAPLTNNTLPPPLSVASSFEESQLSSKEQDPNDPMMSNAQDVESSRETPEREENYNDKNDTSNGQNNTPPDSPSVVESFHV